MSILNFFVVLYSVRKKYVSIYVPCLVLTCFCFIGYSEIFAQVKPNLDMVQPYLGEYTQIICSDGSKFLTSRNGYVSIWETESGRFIKTLLSGEGTPFSWFLSDFSSDIVVLSTNNGYAEVWDFKKDNLILKIYDFEKPKNGTLSIRKAIFDSVNNYLFIACNQRLSVWDLSNSILKSTYYVNEGVVSIEANKQRTRLLTKSFDGTVTLLSMISFEPVVSFFGRCGDLGTTLGFTQDGNSFYYLSVCSSDSVKNLAIRSSDDGRIIRLINTGTTIVNVCASQHSPRIAIYGLKDEIMNVQIWNLSSYSVENKVTTDLGNIKTLMVFGSNDREIIFFSTYKIWKLSLDGEQVIKLVGSNADNGYRGLREPRLFYNPVAKRFLTFTGQILYWFENNIFYSIGLCELCPSLGSEFPSTFPDSTWLFYGAPVDKSVDLDGGVVFNRGQISISPRKDLLFYGTTMFWVYDALQRKELWRDYSKSAVVWGKSGELIITQDYEHKVQVRDPYNGKVQRTITKNNEAIINNRNLYPTANGKIVIEDDNQELSVWNAESGDYVCDINLPERLIKLWTTDEHNTIVTMTRNNFGQSIIELWNAESGRLIKKKLFDISFEDLTLNPKRNRIALSYKKATYIYTFPNFNLVCIIDDFSKKSSVTYSSNWKYICFVGNELTKVYSGVDGNLLHIITGENILFAKASEEYGKLVTFGLNNEVRIWKINDDVSLSGDVETEPFDKLNRSKIVLFPNPTDNYINFSINERLNQKMYYEIRNGVGEILLSGSYEQENDCPKIEVSELSVGMYTIIVHVGELWYSDKFIVCR